MTMDATLLDRVLAPQLAQRPGHSGTALIDDNLEAFALRALSARVRVLLDDINARGQDAAILALDSHPLIDVRMFNPGRNRDGIWMRATEMALRAVSLNRRMHSLDRRRQGRPRRRTQYRR
ncbi:hypothetical protein [Janthinobacterium sp. LB3P112]|uniref:hypothetical protein n=1 Tax=Janthinobacterium sp. LB3P112 TaxID=3424196 RepID=UPI003F2780C8